MELLLIIGPVLAFGVTLRMVWLDGRDVGRQERAEAAKLVGTVVKGLIEPEPEVAA